MFEIKNVKISDLHINNGQVEGLPKNPRFIKNKRFDALKKSIEDAPEMLSLREIIAYDNNGELVVIGGNMRLRALKDLGYKEVSCKILDKNTPVEKLREYAIKDNVGFGEDDFDLLANEWDFEELTSFGLEIPNITQGKEIGNFEEVELKPFESAFCFIKYDLSKQTEVEEIISKLKDIKGVDYEFGGK